MSLAAGVGLMYIYQIHAKGINPLLARMLIIPFLMYNMVCWAMDIFAFVAQATLGLEVW